MIKSLVVLPGLPGDGRYEVKNYSPGNKGAFREGVAVKLTDENNQAWIGNFQTEGRLKPFLFSNGLAVISAGTNCYFVEGKSSEPKVLSSHCEGSVWVWMQDFSKGEKKFVVLGGSHGFLACVNERGEVTATSHLGEPCEDVKYDGIDKDLMLRGSYCEINLKKRFPFTFKLPELTMPGA